MTKIIENKLSSDDEQKFDEILQLLFENQIFNFVGQANNQILQSSYDLFCTEYGIQQKDVSKLTITEIRILFRTMYQNNQCHYIQDPQLAYAYFDSVLKLQQNDAVEILQKAIGEDLEVDGKMGKTTLIKANSMNPKQLAQQLIQQRKIFYAELIKADPDLMFIEKDWNNGLNKIADIISDEVLSKRLSGKTSMLQRAQNLEAQYDQCRKGEVENKNLEGFDFHLDLINLIVQNFYLFKNNEIKQINFLNLKFYIKVKIKQFSSNKKAFILSKFQKRIQQIQKNKNGIILI